MGIERQEALALGIAEPFPWKRGKVVAGERQRDGKRRRVYPVTAFFQEPQDWGRKGGREEPFATPSGCSPANLGIVREGQKFGLCDGCLGSPGRTGRGTTDETGAVLVETDTEHPCAGARAGSRQGGWTHGVQRLSIRLD
ncbi:MAG: hypothetical protein KatS3mg059_0686 [Thermomicrobiales bacterium]|nr:MAG: hypothetical protein KatS3mg059_0686 [Thermomicrobiales bacterium]